MRVGAAEICHTLVVERADSAARRTLVGVIIIHGKPDVLVEKPGDAAAHRLADDPALRSRLSAGARALAIAEFDDRLMAQRTLDLYESMLKGRPRLPEPELSQWVQAVNRETATAQSAARLS